MCLKFWCFPVVTVTTWIIPYLLICLLIPINIQAGTQLTGITVDLVYHGTEMSRGQSSWGDLSWLALMRHGTQTRQTGSYGMLAWIYVSVHHSPCLCGHYPDLAGVAPPAVKYGDQISQTDRTRTRFSSGISATERSYIYTIILEDLHFK